MLQVEGAPRCSFIQSPGRSVTNVRRLASTASRTNGKCLHQRQSRRSLKVAAIGFDFGDREHAEDPPRDNRKKMSSLGTLAASMLVLTPVLKGSVAEAFLACLTACQKYQASNKDVLASFSKFYSLLLASGYGSWQDYLLDQLLLARDNSLARAIAQGSLEDGAPIIQALAHDLDALQVLAVSLSEMSEYVGASAPFAGPEWVSAASSVSIKRKTRSLGSGKPPRVEALNLDNKTQYITRPPTPDELAAWKDVISSKEHWGQAVPVLMQYWHQHGFGITSRNATLRWVKGTLDEASDSTIATPPTMSPPVASTTTQLAALPGLEKDRAWLAQNTAVHCRGGKAQHVLIMGPSGTGKSWLAWDSTLQAGRELGLRLVDLNGADAATIVEAARGCGRYPRIRFVLVADHIDLPLRGSAATELMAGLSSVSSAGWPSNTLLYLVASPSSTVNKDPIVQRFGHAICTKHMTKEEYKEAIQSLTGSPEDVDDSILESAVRYAESSTGGLSIRAASQFVELYASRE